MMDRAEQIARIIDPDSWAVMDGYAKEWGDKPWQWPDQFKHRESLSVARDVLALIDGTQPAQPPFERIPVTAEVRDWWTALGDAHLLTVLIKARDAFMVLGKQPIAEAIEEAAVRLARKG